MITVYPVQPITVAAAALPANASQELAGQLQRTADLLERMLLELRTQSLLLVQLNQPSADDPETVAEDARLALQ